MKKNVVLNPKTEQQKKENQKIMYAEARKSMSKKEYKKFTAASRNTMGQGMHSDVFKDRNDKKRRRNEGKKMCRDVGNIPVFFYLYGDCW